jgi:hypothetical protein
MADPTFNVLIKIREDLAGLTKAISGMQQLNAAVRGSGGVLDQFGRPAQAAAAAIENTGAAAKTAEASVQTLRRGIGTAAQTMGGFLGAARALPAPLQAVASGVNGLLGAIAAGFGPLGVAVAAVSVVAGLAYAFDQQLAAAAERAGKAMDEGRRAAEQLGGVQMEALKTELTAIETKATSAVTKLREMLSLQAEVSGAERAARVAQISATPGLPVGVRPSAIAAENVAAKQEQLRATVLLAETEAKARAEAAAAAREEEERLARLSDAAADEKARLEEQLRLYREMKGLRSVLFSGADVAGEDVRRYFELARRPDIQDQEGEDASRRRGTAEAASKSLTEQYVAAQNARLAAEKEASDAATRHSELSAAAARIQIATQQQATAEVIAQTAAEKEKAEAERKAAAQKTEQERLAARQIARAQDEMELSRQLGEIALERAAIEANRFLTAEQKQPLLNAWLAEENRLLQEKIDKLDTLIAAEADPKLRLELQRERDSAARQQAGVQGTRQRNRPLGVGENVAADLTSFADSFGTRAEAIARLWTGPIKAGISATRDVMNQLLGTTDYWQKKLGTIGGSIVGSITSAISDMWAQWIAGQIQSFVLEKVFRQQRKAELGSEIALNTANAAVASVGSFGTAAIVGMAALLAVLAMFGGFETGGFTGGTRGRAAGLVHGEEFVFSAEAVDALGRDYLEEMHGAARGGAAPVRGDRRGAIGGGQTIVPVYVGLLNHRSEQRRFQRQEGAKISYDFAMRHSRRV